MVACISDRFVALLTLCTDIPLGSDKRFPFSFERFRETEHNPILPHNKIIRIALFHGPWDHDHCDVEFDLDFEIRLIWDSRHCLSYFCFLHTCQHFYPFLLHSLQTLDGVSTHKRNRHQGSYPNWFRISKRVELILLILRKFCLFYIIFTILFTLQLFHSKFIHALF